MLRVLILTFILAQQNLWASPSGAAQAALAARAPGQEAEASRLTDLAAEEFGQARQWQQQGQILLDHAIWLYRSLHSSEARVYLDRLEVITRQHGLKELEANRILNYGNTYHLEKNIDQAIVYYKQASEYAQTHKIPHTYLKAQINLSGMYIHLNRFTDSIETLNKVLDESKRLGIADYQSHCLANLAYIYSLTDQPRKAIEVNDEALALDTAKGRNITRLTLLINQSAELKKIKDFPRAIALITEAIELSKELQFTNNLRVALNFMGQIQRAMNKPKAARDYFLAAYHTKGDSGSEILRSLLELIDIELSENNLQGAAPYFKQAETLIQKANDKDFNRHFHELAARFHEASGEPIQALYHQKRLAEVKDELFNLSTQKQLANLDSRYQNEAKQSRIELLEKEKAMASLQRTYILALAIVCFVSLLITYNRYRVKNRAKKEIEDLLNSMRHALFLIDRQAIMRGPVSQYCSVVFGEDCTGRSVFEVLFKGLPPEARSAVESVFTLCFHSDRLQWDLVHDQLPADIPFLNQKNEERSLKCSYNPIFDSDERLIHIMCVVEDQTELARAQQRLEEERSQNIENFDILRTYVAIGFKSARAFFQNSAELMRSYYQLLTEPQWNSAAEVECARIIHTIKGNARQKAFHKLSRSIHAMEQSLASGHGKEAFTQTFLGLMEQLFEHAQLGQAYFDQPNDISRLAVELWNQESRSSGLSITCLQGILKSVHLHSYADRLITLKDVPIISEELLQDPKVLVSIHGRGNPELVEVYQENLRFLRNLPRDREQSLLQHAIDVLDQPPLARTFEEFRPMVLEIAERLGKKINYVTAVEYMALGKKELWLLADSVTHMLRNCLDHGIESPAERLASGKPEQGTITLICKIIGRKVQITIEDDGRGIDKSRIEEKAKSLGLLPSNSQPQPNDLLQLIFMPHFSTKDEATEVSGRGVGMYAVKTNIESLRGSIHVDAAYQVGTRFLIEFPLPYSVNP